MNKNDFSVNLTSDVYYQPVFYWRKPRRKSMRQVSSGCIFDNFEDAFEYASAAYDSDRRKWGYANKYKDVELICDFLIDRLYVTKRG